MRHPFGVQHRMWQLAIPLENRQCARIRAADRGVPEPVDTVVDVHHLMPVFMGSEIGKVVLSPTPLPQHLDTVQFMEDA